MEADNLSPRSEDWTVYVMSGDSFKGITELTEADFPLLVTGLILALDVIYSTLN